MSGFRFTKDEGRELQLPLQFVTYPLPFVSSGFRFAFRRD